MERKLSVTAACTLANAYVDMPVKSGQTSWQVSYRESNETTARAMQADSYAKAIAMMVETKALMAIEFLGKSWGYAWNEGPDIDAFVDVCAGMNWREAVSLAHKQAITQ